jgi:hypothetical protein
VPVDDRMAGEQAACSVEVHVQIVPYETSRR